MLRAFVLTSLAVILLGMPLLLYAHRIRPEFFQRIRPGMTEADVEQLLGVPAGNYDGYEPGKLFLAIRLARAEPSDNKFWASRHGAVCVGFDNHGRVTHHFRVMWIASTWWARLVDRLLPQRPREDWCRVNSNLETSS